MPLRSSSRRWGHRPVSSGGRLWVTPDGHVESVDAGLCTLLGVSSEDLVGRQVADVVRSEGGPLEGPVVSIVDDAWFERKDGSRLHLMVGIGVEHGRWHLLVQDGTARFDSQERIRQSEQQLRRAQQIARIGSWTWDVVHDSISWSQELYDIYGVDSNSFEASYDAFISLIHPDDREAVTELIQGAFENAKSFTVRHRVLRPDGVIRHVIGQGAVETDAEGNTVHMYGVSQDVTDQVMTGRSFEALLEAAPDAMVLADAAGAIQFVNEEAERMFGYNREELVGKQVEILMPSAVHDRHKHHRTSYQENPERRPMGQGLDLVARRKDGTEFTAEISLSPLETENGLVVTAAIRDTTERRRMEQEAKDRQTRLESLLDNALDAVVLTDLEGRVVEWNTAAEHMFAVSQKDAEGQLFHVFAMAQKARKQFLAILKDTAAGKEDAHRVWVAELRGAAGDFPVEASLARVESGDDTFLLAVIRDITERRKAEESDRLAFERLIEIQQLREVNRFKTLLLNTASHELNTPMTPLRLQLHLLESGRLGELSDRQKHSVEVLQRNVERLSMLIQDVLDVARLESGKLKIVQKPLNIDGIIKEALDTFDQPIAKADLKVTVHAEEGLMIRADRNRMIQVLVNLISNAIKFSPEGGSISVEAHAEGGLVLVQVIDGGPGLTAEQIGNLFQPFSQVHDLRRTNLPGTGLGLYISKGIIEQHGGTIGVESAGPGKGATFWFRLPRYAPDQSPA